MGLYKESAAIYKHKSYFTEYLFSLFMFMFMLVKPITQPTGYNGAILFALSVICIVFEIIHNTKKVFIINKYLLFSSLTILVLILLNTLTRPSSNEATYLYNYLLYGFLPTFFLSFTKNFAAILRFYTFFSLLVGFIYLVDPFLDYQLSGGYMPFGFNVMLPTCTGCILLIFYYKEKIGFLFLLLFILVSLIFSNKGATLSSLLVFIFGYVYISTRGKHIFGRSIFSLLFILLLITSLSAIVEFGWVLTRLFNVNGSYALSTLQMILDGKDILVYGTRFDVWQEAINMYSTNPNTGVGIGYFEKYSLQPYPHNFYLQVLVESGIYGATIFTLFLLISFYKLFKMKDNDKKIFTFLMLIQWTSSLMISLSYWVFMPFWIYWALCFMDNSQNCKI